MGGAKRRVEGGSKGNSHEPRRNNISSGLMVITLLTDVYVDVGGRKILKNGALMWTKDGGLADGSFMRIWGRIVRWVYYNVDILC